MNLKHYEDASKNLRSGVAVTTNGFADFGAIAETNSYYAASLISAYTLSDGQRSAIMPFVSAIVWVRVGSQVMRLSASYPFLGKASIVEANNALLTWLKDVTDAN